MKVSVVIPTYNRAHRLPVAIESALQQRHTDLEIVVVDDGSSDHTRDVVAAYGARVKYVHQANAGCGAARNTGIRHAAGDFIAFLDSDDRWHDYKLSMQLALFAARPDVGLVFSDFAIEGKDGTLTPHGASLWAGRDLDFPEMDRVVLSRPETPDGLGWPADTVECHAGPMYRQLLDELPILTSSVMVRRAVLDSSTWYAERVVLFEDWQFFASVARRAAVGYITAATTVNVGHGDPGRVSKCSNLDRATSYLTLLERVWLSDETFKRDHAAALQSARGRGLLAVAREALLAGERDCAKAAADEWWRATSRERPLWGVIYGLCTRLVGGRTLLRNVLRGRALTRMVLGTASRTRATVNPAA